jgi:four helix bundle protein
VRDHRKLEAFRLADELAIDVYRATQPFPATEQYGLTSQMRRCAVSVAANIVEGSARETEKEYLRFLGIAFGSVRELGYFVSLARRLGYLDDEAAEGLEISQNRAAGSLGALIQALRG